MIALADLKTELVSEAEKLRQIASDTVEIEASNRIFNIARRLEAHASQLPIAPGITTHPAPQERRFRHGKLHLMSEKAH